MRSQSRADYLFKIDSKNDFDLLKGEPLSKNFNGIECVKIIYVVDTKKLYYLESKKYKWHFPFVNVVLGDEDDLDQFNLKNYSNTKIRKYILATFNYNVNTKNYFLQFAACDNPGDELIQTLVEKVTSTFFKKEQFKLLLNSTVLLRRKAELEKKYKTISSNELFRDQSYQLIFPGRTTGILKFIDADSIRQNKSYADYILILKGNSNQIPVCKAVVTSEFQTPLSHICLLTCNRKTPCAAQKNIFSIDSLKKFNSKFVEIIVDKDNLSIRHVKAGIEKKSGGSEKKVRLNSDTLTKEMADLAKLSHRQKVAYGSKVCNLAEIKKIKFQGKSLNTPENAFAIPFYFYMEHIRRSGAERLIKELLADNNISNNDSLLEKKLKKIRKKIRKTKINAALLQHVNTLCEYRYGKNKVRFRSSSNCEDEANFSGAGLYTSETGIVGDTAKSIENAIKKVWASLWSNRAFNERSFFKIDHSTVYMGVLVNPVFDGELLNGVAVTKNLYRNYDFGFVINMQKGENEVVAPKAGLVCEQVISYMNNTYADFYNKNRSADWLSFSSLNANTSLLSPDELLQLTLQLESIKKHFYGLYKIWSKKEYKHFAMDVEFKLIETADKKRVFMFKQARPYNN